jgi:lipid II:glycine glycyltransferase (peptidoglycan interpeptide bridge formation enzyme)
MAVRFEPRLESAPDWAFRGFGRAPFDLIPRETLYIDLTLPESELLASMQPKGRYNIRLAQRHGVKVEEETFSGGAVHKLHSILTQASRRDHFLIEPLSFFSDLAETLCPAGLARLFFAEQEGETLGALVLLTYGSRATYLYGGTSNTKREMMAGYALQWAAMQTAQQAGCATYDMYGYDQFGSPENQYAKFSRFKKQFGGRVKRFIGAQDCFFVDRLADVVIKAFAEIEPAEKGQDAGRSDPRSSAI